MSESSLTKPIIELLAGYSERTELKELCINLRGNRELAIGGRTMLISELVEDQPFNETVGCIQVIFASSSNDLCFGEHKNNNEITEEIRKKLIHLKNSNELKKCIENFSHTNLLAVAPLLEKVTFENKW